MAGNVVNIAVKTTGAEATAKSFDQIGQKARGIGLAVGAMGAGIMLLSNRITEANRNLVAQTGATGAELDALSDSFRKVAGNVPQDMREVADAVGAVSTKLGLTGTDLEETTKMFLDLSRITGVELEPVLRQTSDAMGVFGVASTETRTVMDSLLRASQDSGVGMGRLSSRMQEFGPVMKNLNLNFNESLGFISAMEGAGISLSRVMPALNMSMRRLAESGVSDVRGALNDQMIAIKNAENSTEALRIATEVFGAEGAQRMSLAIKEGIIPDLNNMNEVLGDSDGAVAELTEGTDTLAESLKEMANRLQISLAPYNELLEVLGPVLGLVGTLGVSVLAIAKVAAIFKALAFAVGTAVTAIAGFVAAPVAVVAGVIILIVAIVAGAIFLIHKHWEEFLTGLGQIWENGFLRMFDGFKDWVGGIKDLAKAIINMDFDAMKDAFLRTIKGMFNIYAGFINIFLEAWKQVGNAIKLVFSTLPDSVKAPIFAIMRIFADGINFIIRQLNKIPDINLPDFMGGGRVFSGFNLSEIKIPTIPTQESTGRMFSDGNIGSQGGTGAIVNNVTVEMYGNNYGFDDFDEVVATSVNRGLNNGGFNGFAPATAQFDGA